MKTRAAGDDRPLDDTTRVSRAAGAVNAVARQDESQEATLSVASSFFGPAFTPGKRYPPLTAG
jgi:hypothetical protein